MDLSYYRGCWHEISRSLFIGYSHLRSSPIKAVYAPKSFILHATSLHQAFAHCGRFSTAATRRCLGRVAVPMVGVRLSPPLAVIALVSRYLTNKLIARRPFPERITPLPLRDYRELANLSVSYARLWGKYPRVTTPFATARFASGRLTCMPYPRRQRSS